MGQDGRQGRRGGANTGFFGRLFTGPGTRNNFRAAQNLQSRAPEVVAQSPDSRITMYDDNSFNAMRARRAATRLYGEQVASSLGRRAVIEVQSPNGQWAPVNQADPGAPMDAQIAALGAFRQTGQLGAENQTNIIGSDALPGADEGVNDENALLFGPPAGTGSTGGAGGGAANPQATPAITENALPELADPSAQALPQDPNNPTGFGDRPQIGFIYNPSTPGLPNDPNSPTGPGAAAVLTNPAEVARATRSGSAGNASGQTAGAPSYQANLDAAVAGNGGNAGGTDLQQAAFTDPAMERYANAITSIESAGTAAPYQALGPIMKKGRYAGDRAYGRFQVMGGNIPQWTEQALGVRMTPEQFLADPDAQDAVFADQFQRSIDRYGSPRDAASVWFTGRPASDPSAGTASDGYITGNEYLRKFDMAMGGEASAQPTRGGPDPTRGSVPPPDAQAGTDAGGGGNAGGVPGSADDSTPIDGPAQFAPAQLLTAGSAKPAGGGRGAGGLPPVQMAALGANVEQYKFF